MLTQVVTRRRSYRRVLSLCLAAAALTAGARSPAQAPSAGPTLLGQPIAEYALRRAAVRRQAGDAIVLLRAPAENEDIDRERYRSDNDFVYLTGVEVPGAWLAMLPEHGGEPGSDVLFLPRPSPWIATSSDPELQPGPAASQATGIASIEGVGRLWSVVDDAAGPVQTVYLSAPAAGGARDPVDSAVGRHFRAMSPAVAVRDAGPLIHPLRRVKSPAEISMLRAAIRATLAGERAAAQAIRPGVTELAVEGSILQAFRREGAPREGFPCVVGSGPDSVILHHFSGPRIIAPGEVVVVDIGAERNYYTGDITRTYPSGGRFTPRQRALYQLVLDTQRACEEAVIPGKTTLEDLQRVAVGSLRRSALRAQDRAGSERTMEAFYTHAIGHWLGMDVHDVGGGGVLDPGVVFTIEPGVYIASEGIGIRIEDDYVVTQTGVEKLSRALPARPADIEAIMEGRS